MNVKNSSGYHTAQVVLTSAFIAGIGLFIIYFLKGIYPFGSRSIAYYDMPQSFVPLYYRTYDVLHGEKSLFWDWYSGLGVSVVDALGSFILSPFNLFFFFVKRENILESMSFFLVLKVCFCAGTMSFYTKKSYRNLSDLWHILFGIMYCSCGFVIQYYTSIYFLDIVALFPIIMYFVDKLIEEGKYVGVILCMALSTVVNLYFTFMIGIYLLLYSAVRISDYPKEEQKKKFITLGVSVVISLCLSAMVTLPYVWMLLHSSRVEVTDKLSNKHIVWQLVDRFFGNKLLMLYGCEAAICVIILLLIFRIKKERTFIKWIGLAGLLIIPIWFELINLAWHPGGYVEFPMRFGYILSFTLIAIMGRILNNSEQFVEPKSEKIKRVLHYGRLLFVAILPFSVIALWYFLKGFEKYGARDTSAYAPYYSIMLLLGVLFAIAIICFQKKSIPVVCGIVIMTQFLLGWYGFLAPEDRYSNECQDDIVRFSEKIHPYIEQSANNSFERIKDASNSLNVNYPFIIEKAAISNWTWGGKESVRKTLGKLGYSTHYTRFLDNGGTIFSDAFMNVREVISYDELSDKLYNSITQADEYYLSETKHSYPFGLIVSDEIVNWNTDENITPFQYQNDLFRKISGYEGSLIKQYEEEETFIDRYSTDESTYLYFYQIPVEDLGVLYLQIENKDQSMIFYMNGQVLRLPDIGISDNIVYPGQFVNGLVEFGVFENEVVICGIETVEPLKGAVTFGVLDVNTLYENMDLQNETDRTITVGKQSMEISIVNKSGNNLLLPIGYDPDFVVKVNGKEVKAEATMDGAFMVIPIESGTNQISLVFRPAGTDIGIIITVAGIILFGLFIWKGNLVINNKWIGNVAFVCFYVCLAGFMAYLYIIPFIKTVIGYAQYRL